MRPEPDSPAFDVAAFHHCAAYDDADALRRFADQADAVTFEFENIPAEALAIIEGHSRLAPPRRALEVAQDRLEERRFLTGLGLPVSPYEEIRRADDLPAAWDRLAGGQSDARLFLKKARLGYDGKGQMRIENRQDLDRAQGWLGADSALLEQGVAFWFELSVLCVRDAKGDIAFYDPPQNVHRDGILHESIVPAPMSGGSFDLVYGHARQIAEALDYVGVLAVEMQAASLFCVAQARRADLGMVALVNNGVDQADGQFDTGGHEFRLTVLGAVARAARAHIQQRQRSG
ncbi:MAG: ATP-grasp domain-containing protein [Rhodomicrobium sp.]|nr:ATP-grasp domain-containing protein [Rhodomicrobium sp.]